MGTFLFDKIVFGPINSRRLGRSLGINILPTFSKLCNYNCVYCECGFSIFNKIKDVPDYNLILEIIEKEFINIKNKNINIDIITFAGNGEPTLHPKFSEIVNGVLNLRNTYLKEIEIAVLTNATKLSEKKVVNALNKIDKPILKLDTVIQNDYELINCSKHKYYIKDILNLIKNNITRIYIQTIFFRANINGKQFDNTIGTSFEEYLKALKYLQPCKVMIYSIARDTPIENLEKISEKQLNEIGEKIKEIGLDVLVTP